MQNNNDIIYKILKRLDDNAILTEKEMELIQSCNELDWSFRDFVNIPHSISWLTHLRFLNLSGIGLTMLSEEICALPKLTGLVLRDNKLTGLPQSFNNLKQLQTLDLSGNPWLEVPEQIKSLSTLKYINLSNCAFSVMPSWILDFELDFQFTDSASGIILENTTSMSPDISLFHQKRTTILKYFQRLKENGQVVRETKIIFLGDGLVGKTYTIDRIDNNGKKLNPNHTPDQTKGISIIHKDFEWNQQPITLHFWDFGGQEIMHSMHRCFLTNNTIYVIVLSGRAEDMERRLRYWMTSLNSFTAGNCPVIVLENRFDVRNIQSVNTTQIRRQYTNISAVLSLNVKDASDMEFGKLQTAILDLAVSKSLYGQKMPKLWADVKQALEESAEPYLTERQFMALLGNEINDEELHNILDWFNELGVSFSCHKDTNHCILPDYVVLNPEWATNAIYAIITSQESNIPSNQAFDGILTLAQIVNVLRKTKFVNKKGGIQQEYSRTEIKYILELMEHFQISYEVSVEPERKEFIPSLCQSKEPEDIKQYMSGANLHFEIRYDYLPSNILHRFMISRFKELDAGRKWWYSGGVFQSDDYQCQALVLQESRAGKDIISIYLHQYADGEAWRYLSKIRRHVKEAGLQLNIASDSYIIYREPGQNQFEDINLVTVQKSLELGWTSHRSVVFGKEIPFSDILQNVTTPDVAKAAAQKDLFGVIISGCCRMQKRCSWLPKEEDKRNDYLCDILRSAQIFVLDQTRSGIAQRESGELDFVIQDNKLNDIAIIEALNLSSIETTNLQKHIEKLMSDEQYNVNGLHELYLLVYADVKNFSAFCNRYDSFINEQAIYPYDLKKQIERIEQKVNNICVWKATYINKTTVHHICVKMLP